MVGRLGWKKRTLVWEANSDVHPRGAFNRGLDAGKPRACTGGRMGRTFWADGIRGQEARGWVSLDLAGLLFLQMYGRYGHLPDTNKI